MVSLVTPRPSAPPHTKSNLSKPLPAQNAPSKPALRRATLSGTIRKSDDAGLDSDILSVPPSPKKQKVTFNPEVEEKVMEDYSPKSRRSLEAVRGEVRRAIEGHGRGDSEAYDSLKEIFAPRRGGEDESEVDQGEMKQYLLALSSNAALLNRTCNGLVGSLLACEWMGRDEGFVKAYVHFLGSLASAQGMYVGSVLAMLVGHFSGVRMSSGRLPDCPVVNREQLFSRIHVALKFLLRLIPSASSTLSPILSSKFPFSDDSKKAHIAYIENLIRLTEYAPELKSDIFALITDRLVKIDVQMQVDLDDLDDEVAAAIVQALSLNPSSREEEADEEDSDSDADSVTSNESLDIDSKRIKEVQGNVEKMDAILDLLFTIYGPYFSDPHSVEAASMFETLLGHFANIILPTYRSRHTQFLLFHFAQTAEHLIDQFAGTCVQLAFQSGRPAVLRQSSASYLASFVARGAHVQPHVIRTVFELIGSHLDHIRAENELSCRGPDLQRYGTFYAMTQALLYIFCFRWRDLTTDEVLDEDDPSFIGQDLNWIPGIKDTLSRTIYSKLNPLKICSPPIVAEFAKIARHLRFMYVYPLLETNKRLRLSQFASSQGNGALRDTGNGGHNESWHQLDAYFPFDPYQLPVSKRWVEADYVQWRGIPGLDAEEDDDESGDEEEDEDAEVEEDTATDDGDDE